MTTETYTSKDGRVTVRDYDDEPSFWAVLPPGATSPYDIPKDLCPDPQLLADQVAEQQPKPRYVVRREGDYETAYDTKMDLVGAWFNIQVFPDARERAEQAAADLNARAVSDD